MPDLTPQENQAIAVAVARALTGNAGADGMTMAAPSGSFMPAAVSAGAVAAGIDPKSTFCANWPTVRTVLVTLQSIVPPPANLLVGLVIGIGDGISKAICH